MSNSTVKTRFAPSPTGSLHMGNCRTALLSALYAKHAEGIFLLRIEDTDTERSYENNVTKLLTDLHWLGIEWQEGPYWQSQRHDVYQTYYTQLQMMNKVYPCFCSKSSLAMTRKLQLSAGKPPRYLGTCRSLSVAEVNAKIARGLKPTLRLRMPDNMIFEFDDLVKGHQRFSSADIGDFIIRRADGGAIFMFCNAIDDALMGVTHVIRGEDHLTNTPRQLAILQALGMQAPRYGHISLILAMDGSKLSKRNGSLSIQELRNLGYLPLAITNYLVRLGHYYAVNKVMSYSELAQEFSPKNLNKAAARFDEQQLRYWQKQALQQLSIDVLWSILPVAVHRVVPLNRRDEFINLVKPNILFPQETTNWATVLFAECLAYSSVAADLLAATPCLVFEAALAGLVAQQHDFVGLIEFIKQQSGLKDKALFQPLRVALTGDLHGPEMTAIADFLGPEKMQQRFRQALSIARLNHH